MRLAAAKAGARADRGAAFLGIREPGKHRLSYAAELLSGMNRSFTGYGMNVEAVRDPQRVRTMIEGHLRDVASGGLKVVIDRTYPLSEAAEAHRYIESRQAFGRVVIAP